MYSRLALLLIVLLTLASPARAQVTFFSSSNLNATVVDDGYNGALASMTCVNVPVSGIGNVQGVSVIVNADDTWVGDLVFKAVSPSNTVVTLMSRPGVVEAADDGTAVGGDSSDLSSTFPLTFADGAAKSAELMGNTLGNTGVVCRDDMQCNYDPNAGAATPGKLSAFIGQASAGTWKFCAGDGGVGDVGVIQRVGFRFVAGVLQVSLPTTDFGTVPVSTTSGEQFVTLTNMGNGSLTIDSVTAANPPFARTASGTCGNTFPKTLAVAESCTLSYTFAPTAQGPAMQSFQLPSNGGGDTGFTLTGTGAAPLPDAIFADGFE